MTSCDGEKPLSMLARASARCVTSSGHQTCILMISWYASTARLRIGDGELDAERGLGGGGRELVDVVDLAGRHAGGGAVGGLLQLLDLLEALRRRTGRRPAVALPDGRQGRRDERRDADRGDGHQLRPIGSAAW